MKVVFINILIIAPGLLSLTGCEPALSSPEKILDFRQAGPVSFRDTSNAGRFSPYRVISGDLLDLQIPAVMMVISSNVTELARLGMERELRSYSCRVNDSGNIVLPIVGEIHVVGKTEAEIESAVIDAYYPKYVANLPMVVCEVSKYQNESESVFAVMGLVKSPGTYPYPPDVQYNLVEALAFAGGLDLTADPLRVKVHRQKNNGEIVTAVFGVGSKYYAQSSLVAIKPGDIISVDHTLRTRINKFFADVLNINVGASSRYDYDD